MTTHGNDDRNVAVALEWSGTGAPRVTAKGRGEVADRILEIAVQNGIPQRHERELVELLLLVDLDREIPPALYVAVAEVIAFAYSLSGRPPPSSVTPAASRREP